MAEFLAMDGYGIYIWPCYGLSLLILGSIIVSRFRRLAKLRRLDRDRSPNNR